MDQASLMGFFKTVLIIVLIYYFIKFAFKLLAPYLMKKAVDKLNDNFQQQQRAYQNQQYGPTSGNEAHDDFESSLKQNKIPKERKKVGEYIDYEEVN